MACVRIRTHVRVRARRHDARPLFPTTLVSEFGHMPRFDGVGRMRDHRCQRPQCPNSDMYGRLARRGLQARPSLTGLDRMTERTSRKMSSAPTARPYRAIRIREGATLLSRVRDSRPPITSLLTSGSGCTLSVRIRTLSGRREHQNARTEHIDWTACDDECPAIVTHEKMRCPRLRSSRPFANTAIFTRNSKPADRDLLLATAESGSVGRHSKMKNAEYAPDSPVRRADAVTIVEPATPWRPIAIS